MRELQDRMTEADDVTETCDKVAGELKLAGAWYTFKRAKDRELSSAPRFLARGLQRQLTQNFESKATCWGELIVAISAQLTG